jgi:hypothetical protein
MKQKGQTEEKQQRVDWVVEGEMTEEMEQMQYLGGVQRLIIRCGSCPSLSQVPAAAPYGSGYYARGGFCRDFREVGPVDGTETVAAADPPIGLSFRPTACCAEGIRGSEGFPPAGHLRSRLSEFRDISKV